jgi:tetratricopeptide (TPR) repeat protein
VTGCFGSWQIGVSIAVAAVLLGGGSVASAQQTATVALRVDRTTVSEDDQISVRVVAQGEYDEVVPPTSDGFDFESTGRSQQVNIIGAQAHRSDTYSYVGRPRRIGKHAIGPVILRFRGKRVAKSRYHEIEVTSARAALGTAVPPAQALDMRRYRGKHFFVLPKVSAPRPYAGQPFVLSYELFWSRRVHVGNIRELSGPKYEGFEVEDLLGGKPSEQEVANFGGNPYFRQMTRKVLLTAATPGNFEVLGPRYRIEAGDVFSTRAYKVGPPPLAIDVRRVPTKDRPAGYEDGNVGRLKLDGWLLQRDRPVRELSVKVGERVVMHVEVRGMGNLFGVSQVQPAALAGMNVEPLPGRADEHVKTTVNGTEGKRAWQYVLTFDAGGKYEVPQLEFTAFDPFDESFKTSTAGPFTVNVAGAVATGTLQTASAAQPPARGVNGGTNPANDVQPAPGRGDPWQSLRPIAAQAGLAQTAVAPWTSSTWFWRLAGLPWALALLFGMARFGVRRRAYAAPTRQRVAALSEAVAAIDVARGRGNDGYAALRTAVDRFLQLRVGIRLAGLTYADLRTRLRDAGVDDADLVTLCDGLQRCDAMQYAPGTNDKDLGVSSDLLVGALRHIDERVANHTGGVGAVKTAVLLLAASTLAVLSPTPANAASVDDAFSAANRAYIARDYETAQKRYEQLLKHDLSAAAIHYNLGNALVKRSRLGEAVGHYRRAQRMDPEPGLVADIEGNLKLCREQLAERSRRRQRILHVVDESPEIDVALGRSAPRDVVGVIVLAGGFAFFLLLLIGWWPVRSTPPATSTKVTLAAVLLLHVFGGVWLWHAQRMDDAVRYAVVVEEDAPLSPCSGVGETVDLPEGLEVRQLRTRPDGRVEVRLPNGRSGCMQAKTLYGTS